MVVNALKIKRYIFEVYFVVPQVRKSRSLTELIVEAEDIISDPSHNMKVSAAHLSHIHIKVIFKYVNHCIYFKKKKRGWPCSSKLFDELCGLLPSTM